MSCNTFAKTRDRCTRNMSEALGRTQKQPYPTDIVRWKVRMNHINILLWLNRVHLHGKEGEMAIASCSFPMQRCDQHKYTKAIETNNNQRLATADDQYYSDTLIRAHTAHTQCWHAGFDAFYRSKYIECIRIYVLCACVVNVFLLILSPRQYIYATNGAKFCGEPIACLFTVQR